MFEDILADPVANRPSRRILPDGRQVPPRINYRCPSEGPCTAEIGFVYARSERCLTISAPSRWELHCMMQHWRLLQMPFSQEPPVPTHTPREKAALRRLLRQLNGALRKRDRRALREGVFIGGETQLVWLRRLGLIRADARGRYEPTWLGGVLGARLADADESLPAAPRSHGGRPRERPLAKTAPISVRLDGGLHAEIMTFAKREKLSMSKAVENLLWRGLSATE